MAERNALMVVAGGSLATISETTGGYAVMAPGGGEVNLDRDVDFGVVPGTKQPSLFKSGAEKVAMAYGLMQRYTIESEMERFEAKGEHFVFYRVRCDLVKGFTNGNGEYQEVTFCNGRGSANTSEKRNGMNSAVNSANATLKMAEKRALVDAALHVSGLSSMFSQDIENENFMATAAEIIKESPSSAINKRQVMRLFAVAAKNGMTQEEARIRLNALGYAKTSDIKRKDYLDVLKALGASADELEPETVINGDNADKKGD